MFEILQTKGSANNLTSTEFAIQIKTSKKGTKSHNKQLNTFNLYGGVQVGQALADVRVDEGQRGAAHHDPRTAHAVVILWDARAVNVTSETMRKRGIVKINEGDGASG